MASVLCHGLFVHQPAQWSALGAFNLYGATPGAFSDEDQEFGLILAAYVVAVAMAQRRDEVDRREAALSAGDAFDLLRRASQRLNRKLADVAQQLAETGEIPDVVDT